MLTAIAQERGVSPAQVALNWVMNKPCVDTVILGARNEEQLRDNLAAAAWRLSVEEMGRLDEVSAHAGAVSVLAPAQVRAGAEPARGLLHEDHRPSNRQGQEIRSKSMIFS